MGKPKKDRTGQVIDAGKRIVLAEQIQNALEQHNFVRLVAQGVIVETLTDVTAQEQDYNDKTSAIK